MKSVVKVDVDASADAIAAVLADPKSSPKWMDDVKRVEGVSGRTGSVGSRFRLVPKQGSRVFVATVTARDLPTRYRLSLEAPDLTVAVANQLIKLSNRRTRLISEEEFRFKSAFSRAFGFVTRMAIRRTHQRRMIALKHYVEGLAENTEAVNE